MIIFRKLKSKYLSLKIVLHPLFILYGIVLAIIGELSSFVLCTCLALLHELGHFIVASKLGYKMERIRLMPFGAELCGETDAFIDKDEILVAIAGPVVNFVICIICLGSYWLWPNLYGITSEIFYTSLCLGVFNILPIFPLDGGRVVLAYLSKTMPRKKSAEYVKKITKIVAFILFLCFIASIFISINLSLGVMAFLLYFSASFSKTDSSYQKIELETLVKNHMVEWVVKSVPQNTKIYRLRLSHLRNRVCQYIVIDDRGDTLFTFNEIQLNKILPHINLDLDVMEIKPLLMSKNNPIVIDKTTF